MPDGIDQNDFSAISNKFIMGFSIVMDDLPHKCDASGTHTMAPKVRAIPFQILQAAEWEPNEKYVGGVRSPTVVHTPTMIYHKR